MRLDVERMRNLPMHIDHAQLRQDGKRLVQSEDDTRPFRLFFRCPCALCAKTFGSQIGRYCSDFTESNAGRLALPLRSFAMTFLGNL